MADSIYEFKATSNDGSDFDFAGLKGKVLLIVNTASRCGFTPQYNGLQKLYDDYKEKGLVVIGFPCDQFAHQEPGDDQEIKQFCSLKYNVGFPLMSKISVNGKDAHPVYTFLTNKAPGIFGPAIKWNFTKFLIARDGVTVKRYAPLTSPARLAGDIKRLLAVTP